MADIQRTIEILLQFKQAGEELVKQATEQIQAMAPAAVQAAAATAAMPQVGAAAATAGKQMAQAMGQAAESGKNSFHAMIEGIKEEAGRGSLLGETMHLLLGAGPIIGLKYLTEAFAGFAEKIAAAMDETRKGNGDLGEFFGTLSREVPILGGFIKAFDALREAVTGEKAAMEEDAQAVKESEAHWKERQKLIEDGKKSIESWIVVIQKLRDELRLLEAKPEEKGLVQAQINTEDKLQALRVKFEKESKEQAVLDARNKVEAENQAFEAKRSALLQAQQGENDWRPTHNGPSALNPTGAGENVNPWTGEVEMLRKQLDGITKAWADLRDTLTIAEKNLTDQRAEFNTARGVTFAVGATEQTDETKKADEALGKKGEAALAGFEKMGDALKQAATSAGDAWVKMFDNVVAQGQKWAEELKKEGDKVRPSVATPTEKAFQEEMKLRDLLGSKAIDQPTYPLASDKNLKAFDEAQAQEKKLQQDALDKKLLAQDQFDAAVTTGLAKVAAQAKLQYDQDLIHFREALTAKEIDQAQFDGLIQQAAAKRDDTVRKREPKVPELPGATTPPLAIRCPNPLNHGRERVLSLPAKHVREQCRPCDANGFSVTTQFKVANQDGVVHPLNIDLPGPWRALLDLRRGLGFFPLVVDRVAHANY